MSAILECHRATYVSQSQVNLGGGSEVGGFQQCLEFSGSAVLNPVQYLNGLAEAFVAKGGQIYEQTRVQKPDTNHVTTMAGNKVSKKLQCLWLRLSAGLDCC
jgi:glycine/D-amino acid oxidase-like deaminating enzyme